MAKKKIILVVEDEEPLQRAIKAKLEQNNFKVLISAEADSAIGLLEKNKGKVSAVWLDHYLLGAKSGIDFLSEVKSNELWKKMPVFLVSNTASNEKVKAYFKLGVSRYYSKHETRLEEITKDIQNSLK